MRIHLAWPLLLASQSHIVNVWLCVRFRFQSGKVAAITDLVMIEEIIVVCWSTFRSCVLGDRCVKHLIELNLLLTYLVCHLLPYFPLIFIKSLSRHICPMYDLTHSKWVIDMLAAIETMFVIVVRLLLTITTDVVLLWSQIATSCVLFRRCSCTIRWV